jgi:hypothetical protein
MSAVALPSADNTTITALCTGKLDAAAIAKLKTGGPTPMIAPILESSDALLAVVFLDANGKAVKIGDAGIDVVRLFRGDDTQAATEQATKLYLAGFCVPLPGSGTLASIVSDQKNEIYHVEAFAPGNAASGVAPAFFRTVDRLAGTRFEARVVSDAACPKDVARSDFTDKSKGAIAGSSPIEATPSVGADDIVQVAFFDGKGGQMTVKDAMVDSVKFFRDQGSDPVYAVTAAPFEDGNCVPIPGDGKLGQLLKDKDGALYRIEVVFKDGSSLQLKPKYLRRANKWQAYGWDPFELDLLGFWLPVGLFGTNLKSTANGIDFVAVPIGVALGGKWWARDNLFIGGSVLATWTIAHTTSDTSMASGTATGSSGSVTTAKNLGIGGLIDVGGYAYFGGIWVADLTSKHDNPGFMFLAGLGPAAIKAIADGTLRF